MARFSGWWKPVALVGLGVALVYAGYQAGSDQNETLAVRERTVPLPLVLEQVKSLGQLRTAEYSYQNVFEYETNLEPAGWASALPGAEAVVSTTSRNRALVSAHGTVQAGINLEQAHAVRTLDAVVIVLPEPQVYQPVVDAKIHEESSGLFWNDRNLGFKAQRDAEKRFMEASLEQGILRDARESAEEQVRRLVEPILDRPLIIEFAPLPDAKA